MAKLIRTIVPENGLRYNDLLAFRTRSYVGMWDYHSDRFALIETESAEFNVQFIDTDIAPDFEELDQKVYEMVEEHISEVFDDMNYSIELEVHE